MKRFELTTPTMVRLDHAKGRKEHHGDVLVLALDLKVTWTTNNRALEMFDKLLQEALFLPLPPDHGDSDGQAEMDLPVSDLSFIRLKKLEYPLKWDQEYTGWTLRHDYGTGGESDVIVKLCKLKDFRITPIEGGSVEISFGLSSAADIEGSVVGHFSSLMQENITITLLGPNKTEDDIPIDASAGSGAPGTDAPSEDSKAKPAKKTNTDATAAFIAQHTGGAPTH